MREALRIAAHTLGCKVNQYDTERLLACLQELGCETTDLTDADRPADVYIVNTCTVTHTGEMKSLQMLRRVKKLNPNALLAVCGCLVKTNEAAIKKAGADFIFDARRPEDLINRLELNARTEDVAGSNSVITRRRARAYIKIQDGCDRFCSYCIVPHVRGELTSRPLEEILVEARALIAQGVREIVLTGIQAAAYGKDKANCDSVNFPAVINAVAGLPGLSRLRLGSIEPYAVTGEFLDAVSSPVVCPHFHLSLQSGCDKTLRAMNRRYTANQYAELAEKIRLAKLGAALTTDIMAGFPGETEADLEESCKFAEAMKFSRMHVFVYSPRKGTPAADFPEQIAVTVKNERGKKLRRLAEKLADNFLRDNIGGTEQVLFETRVKQNGISEWEGHTASYITVRAKSEMDLTNAFANVKLCEIKNGIVYGGII